ncbi:MAG: transcriptional repressor, partial [Candidatus Omnitrophica bacterium]|nr:transcriptional repressor [Candidatus Omnitrophota bacterium]
MPFGPRWLEARFRGCGFRWTFPRQVILDVLTKEKKHLSAEDIFLKVH